MFRAADFEAKLALRRHRPQKCRPGSEAKLMTRMVLRKTTIRVGVRSTPGTGAEIRDQLVQLDCTPSDLDPDENRARRRSDEQIKLIRRGVMFLFSRLQDNVTSQPAALEDQARGGRELANVFAEKPPRFRQ